MTKISSNKFMVLFLTVFIITILTYVFMISSITRDKGVVSIIKNDNNDDVENHRNEVFQLSIEDGGDPKTKDIGWMKKATFTINVITYNRPKSLKRLITSISGANYYGFNINIRFFVENGADEETMDLVENFEWRHGVKSINYRFKRGGLITAVVESWYPSDNDDYVIMAEDDIELSPFYFHWILECLKKYRYGLEYDKDPNIFGISLYTPRYCETCMPPKEFHPSIIYPEKQAFLYQVPCSWGALFFPEQWKLYRRYLDLRKNVYNIATYKPECNCNGWSGSWVKFFIEYSFFKGTYMIHPNFPHEMSFSTNHVEPGVHVTENDEEHPKERFLVPLFRSDVSIHLPSLKDLPILDFDNHEVDRIELKKRSDRTWPLLLEIMQQVKKNPVKSDHVCLELRFEEYGESKVEIRKIFPPECPL